MDKKFIWIGVAVLVFIGAVFYGGVQSKNAYIDHYNKVCEIEVNFPENYRDDFSVEGFNLVSICKSTNGCFNPCGGCGVEQNKNIFDLFEGPKDCLAVCVPQCVCPYGKNFDEEKGCI